MRVLMILVLFTMATGLYSQNDPLYQDMRQRYENVEVSPGPNDGYGETYDPEMCPQSEYPSQAKRPGQFGTPTDFARRYGGLSPETILKIKQRDPRSPLYNYGAKSFANGSPQEKRQKIGNMLYSMFGY